MKRIEIHVAVCVLAWMSAVGAAVLAAQEPATQAAELTREQKEHFLLHAKILKTRDTKIGVTDSQRATLSDGTLTHDAHIQTVNIYKSTFKSDFGTELQFRDYYGFNVAGYRLDKHKSTFKSDFGTELQFRDYYGFNVAGYRLDKLLELNAVPVTVERRIRRDKAAVGWWVDGVMMNGIEFKKRGFKAPVTARLNDQRAQGLVFQQLIYNTDSNLGNVVIDQDWKGWIFDFTRAFRRWEKLQNPESLHRIGRGLFSRLRELEAAAVERELGPLLRPAEVKGLLARRDLLVQHFERLIAEQGEAAVLIEGEGF